MTLSLGEAPPMLSRQFERFDADGDLQFRDKELAKVGERLARMAGNAENRKTPGRPAANEASPTPNSSRKAEKVGAGEEKRPDLGQSSSSRNEALLEQRFRLSPA